MLRRGDKQKTLNHIKNNRILKAIIFTLDKPSIISVISRDVARRLDIKNSFKITKHINVLEKIRIIKCLTPEIHKNKPGRVYGLTSKGINIKKKLCRETGCPFIYNEFKANWNNYGWSLTGTQKQAIIKAMTNQPKTQHEIRILLREFYRTRNNKKGKSAAILIARGNLNDILQKIIKRGIAEKFRFPRKRKMPTSKYCLTKKGLEIKELISL
jgi:predicted transcriptional regulator